jgi:curved DNA-binding protein CbpA
MRDYYDILNISRHATEDRIREAYRFQIKAFHPHKFIPGTDEARDAQRRTQEILEAYSVLSKRHFRAEYDRFREETGPEYEVESSVTVEPHPKDEAQRLQRSRFQIWRDRTATLQLHVLGPVAALITVSLVAWLLQRHQPETYDTASAMRDTEFSAQSSFAPPALVPEEAPADLTAGKSEDETDMRQDSTLRVTETLQMGEFEASRETHVAWELEQKRDYRNAAKLYQDAAAYGNPDAETNLAKLYLRGKGVPRDENKARALLEKAAEQGHEEAQRILGTIPSI